MTKFFLILVLLQSTTLAQTDSTWTRVEPEGAGFTVLMPAKPIEQVSRKKKLTLHAYIAQFGTAIYAANFSEYISPVTVPADERLKTERDSFNKGIKADLVNSRSITQDDLQGLEFTSETSGATVRGKVFLKGQRVFMIVGLVPKDVDQKKALQTFLDSLTFSEN